MSLEFLRKLDYCQIIPYCVFFLVQMRSQSSVYQMEKLTGPLGILYYFSSLADLPSRPFRSLKKKNIRNFMQFRNVVSRILKLQNGEKVSRVVGRLPHNPSFSLPPTQECWLAFLLEVRISNLLTQLHFFHRTLRWKIYRLNISHCL